MSLSKPMSKKVRVLPNIQEGERVFFFNGPILREAECVCVALEDNEVKYLVRYRPGSGMVGMSGMGMGPMGMTPFGLGPLGSLGLGSLGPLGPMGLGNMWLGGIGMSGAPLGAGASPFSLPVPSTASPYSMPGSSRASPYSVPGPSGAFLYSMPGPSGTSPYSIPGPSGASPYPLSGLSSIGTTSESTILGASFGIYSSDPSTSDMGSSTTYARAGLSSSAGPSTSSSLSETLSSLPWNYEWIPENCMLRFCSSSGRDSDELEKEDYSTISSGACGHTSDPGEGSSHGESEVEAQSNNPREGSEDDMAQPPHKRRDLGVPKKKFLKRREVKVPLPDTLKPLLIKDWDLVNHSKKLFKLPAKKTIDAILAEYTALQQNREILNKQYAVYELVTGIKEYFNVMLGTQLLYKFERPQYAEILANYPNMRLSQIYGGAHLLRLFVQLGSMLAYTALDDNSLSILLGNLQDFLKYIACNPSMLFTPDDYQETSAEYQQIAE